MSHSVQPIENTIAQSEAPIGLATGAPLTVPTAESHSPTSRNMSRTGTLTSEDNDTLADPARTLTDLNNANEKTGKGKVEGVPAESTLGAVEKEKAASGTIEGKGLKPEANTLKDLPPSRKNLLLLCFCLSMFSTYPLNCTI